jgi:hypothetical protein
MLVQAEFGLDSASAVVGGTRINGQNSFRQNLQRNYEVMMKITIFNGKIQYKWSFSIAMLNYQRVMMKIMDF